MKFVSPEFLWALALLAIPIIIHLFNFRKYKTIEFSDIRYLKEVKEETRKKSNLKHIIILISRILVLAALVLAFCQPYTPTGEEGLKQGKTAVSIYIDNSFSMDTEGEDGRFIEMARQIAVEIVNKYGNSTQFQLLTNKLSGSEQRLMNKENFLTQLDELQISSESRTIPNIFKRQADILKKSEVDNTIAYAISDFQTSMLTSDYPKDKIDQYNTILLNAKNRSNVYIDSLWFETPVRKINGIETLKVRIGNESDSLINVKLSRSLNGQINSTRVPINARSKSITELKFTNKTIGPVAAKLYLSLGGQMRFDDTLHFSYNVLKSINVLEISDSEKNTFYNIFGNDELFNFAKSNPNALDVSSIPKQHLIVLNGLTNITSGLAQQLTQFVKNGGSLSIFPGDQIDANSYARLLTEIGTNTFGAKTVGNAFKTELKTYNKSHLFFKDVFQKEDAKMNLPKVIKSYPIRGTYESGEEVLFTMRNEQPFLTQYKVASGKVYLCAVPLLEQYSNFVKHGLFVTSALRMAELSHTNKPLYYTIGAKEMPWIADLGYNSELNFNLSKGSTTLIPIADRSKDGVIKLINAYGKDNNSMITQAGVYDLIYDNRTLEKIAYNYPRQESVLDFAENLTVLKDYYSNFDIAKFSALGAQNIQDVINSIEENGPKTYWKILLIIALSLLALEIILIKLWKN